MFIYKAMRHFAHIQDEYKTLDEAISRAVGDIDNQTAWPLEVADDKGAVILNEDELHLNGTST